MNSAVALALITKAQMVFDADDTFLSFPIATPFVYKPSDLTFMSLDITDEYLHMLREYSHLVDTLPSGVVWGASDDRRLSGVYLKALSQAKLALSARTAQEEIDYQKAVDFLCTTGADGLRSDTPSLRAYKQYRDAYYSLQGDYNNRKINATYSADPAVKDQWLNIDEPALRRQMDEVAVEWAIRGFRAQVEQAKQLEEGLGARQPGLLWATWKQQCDPLIDQVTDPRSNESFYPSGFAPSDALTTGGWSRFTLSDDEVNALVQQAPHELAGRLGSDGPALEIDSLSFECRSVAVERPWFVPDVLKARFWKFADGEEMGWEGDSGTCGYVTALVFARNVHIALKQHSQRNDETLNRPGGIEGLTLGGLRLPALALHVRRPPIVIRAGPAPPVHSAHPAIAVAPPVAVLRRAAPVGPPTRALTRLQTTSFRGIPPPPNTGRPVAAPNRVPEAEPQSTDDINILAFICKRLPVCPNPDPTLQW